MTNDNLITKSFMLAKEDIEKIDTLSEKNGLNNSSAALRMIIREWAALKAGMVTIPKAGFIQDGDKVVVDPKYLEDDKPWTADDILKREG